MPEKAVNLGWILGPNPIVQWWFKLLTMGVFLAILIVWGIDGLNMQNFHNNFALLKPKPLQESNFANISIQPPSETPHQISEILPKPLEDSNFGNISILPHLETPHQISDSNLTLKNMSKTHDNMGPSTARNETEVFPISTPQVSRNFKKTPDMSPWVSSELEEDYSSNLLAKWLAPGGEPCKESRTVDIRVPRLDGDDKSNGGIELPTGEIHEFVFQALGETGEPHCLGGDYFETDLSGEKWKARPPINDMANGTYKFSLQVHPDFAGDYNLTIILLYRHYEGLKFSPARFAFDRVLRVIPIRFVRSTIKLPGIKQCKWSDYTRDIWSGRWTRHARNDNCLISNDGRYRCQKPSFPCENPWCEGPLGLLESNGWVYSAHCSFKLFSSEQAWNCLSGRWIFWWGDSNHCDTIRNMLHFILNVLDIPMVPRIFDKNITNPRNQSQTVRFTSIFNGHPNDTGNYQGLNSLINPKYRELLKGYFRQNTVPDTVIMNSGLHDGVFWSNIRKFIKGADFAAAFWAEVMDGVAKNGLPRPKIIYRTTVTTGGYARKLAFNPQKMEAFNKVVLDKLRRHGVLDRVIDDFDMTYPWHYDNRCNDGVHYGRAPVKMRWRDGQIGHQYFVDLMLGHVLMNALCVKNV